MWAVNSHKLFKVLYKPLVFSKAWTSTSGISKSGLSYTIYNMEKECCMCPNKKPIIFLHGLFGSKGNLHSLAKELSEDKRKVVTYDCRNHGDSQHSSDLNLASMSEDLAGLIEELHLGAPIVMGHSMGGKTSMYFSLNQPDMLSSLIVVDVTPDKSPGMGELVKYAEAMKSVKFQPGLPITHARQQAMKELSSVVTNGSILQFLLTNLRQFEKGQVRWRNNLDAFLNNHEQVADFPVPAGSSFHKPTLFIFGEESPHYNSPGVQKIPTYFPTAEVKSIKKAGHFVHAQQPQEFLRIVREFLSKIEEASNHSDVSHNIIG